MIKWILSFVAGVALSASAHAEKILITNDDGLTSNLKALYNELKAHGHDVIVSVPCQGQSGMGAAIKFLRPLGPLKENCLNNAAQTGAPGVGPMTRTGFENDFYYVDGTPVMATLYGLDILSAKRWGTNPDIVISGPNEGRNVGTMIISSGTVSNVQYSTVRGVASIAVSAGLNTVDNETLANANSAIVARKTAEIVKKLFMAQRRGRSLPNGIALNINFPDKLESANWKVSRIGTYEIYDIGFSTDLGHSEAAATSGIPKISLPGVVLGFNKTAPKSDQLDDEAVVSLKNISISPIQVGYQPRKSDFARKWLDKIVSNLQNQQ